MPDKPRWELSDDDWRLLVITFAGSLGAIIVGAVVLGGALALARYVERGNSLGYLALFSAVTGATWVLFLVSARRNILEFARGSQIRKWWNGGIVVVSALVLSFIALTWIGIAAGIK